ncbi:MAG: arginase family protein, partial [Rhodospirillales bacterium]|nr:arginase family protein [Rhodospirillales bacterium]
ASDAAIDRGEVEPPTCRFGGSALGSRVMQAEECWHRSLTPLMAEVRAQLGRGPVYLSFDIDGLDPSIAPGTGTPEIGGLTGVQGLEIIRGCRGLDLVGCDLVEVAPAYDLSGNTALTAANLLFEMLCVLPGVWPTAIDPPLPGRVLDAPAGFLGRASRGIASVFPDVAGEKSPYFRSMSSIL